MASAKYRTVLQSEVRNPVSGAYNNRVGLPNWVVAVEKMSTGKSVAGAIGITFVLSGLLFVVTSSGGSDLNIYF